MASQVTPHYVYFSDGSYEVIEAETVVITEKGWLEFRTSVEGQITWTVEAWVNPEHVKIVSMKGPNEGLEG